MFSCFGLARTQTRSARVCGACCALAHWRQRSNCALAPLEVLQFVAWTPSLLCRASKHAIAIRGRSCTGKSNSDDVDDRCSHAHVFLAVQSNSKLLAHDIWLNAHCSLGRTGVAKCVLSNRGYHARTFAIIVGSHGLHACGRKASGCSLRCSSALSSESGPLSGWALSSAGARATRAVQIFRTSLRKHASQLKSRRPALASILATQSQYQFKIWWRVDGAFSFDARVPGRLYCACSLCHALKQFALRPFDSNLGLSGTQRLILRLIQRLIPTRLLDSSRYPPHFKCSACHLADALRL